MAGNTVGLFGEGRWSLQQRFSLAIGTAVLVAVVTMYGVRLMGKAATFHFLERNHMELALRIDSALSSVEREANNASDTHIDNIAAYLKQARLLAVRADNEVFGFEQQLLRFLGFGPLIDLPQKDIADVDGMLATIAAFPAQSGPMPVELAQRLRPGMDAMMENSIAFAPLTADAASFIKISVSAVSAFCSLLLIATAFALRRRTLRPLAVAVEAAQRLGDGVGDLPRFAGADGLVRQKAGQRQRIEMVGRQLEFFARQRAGRAIADIGVALPLAQNDAAVGAKRSRVVDAVHADGRAGVIIQSGRPFGRGAVRGQHAFAVAVLGQCRQLEAGWLAGLHHDQFAGELRRHGDADTLRPADGLGEHDAIGEGRSRRAECNHERHKHSKCRHPNPSGNCVAAVLVGNIGKIGRADATIPGLGGKRKRRRK